MGAPAIIASLLLAGFVIWFCLTETPAPARNRDDAEDEASERGPGDEF